MESTFKTSLGHAVENERLKVESTFTSEMGELKIALARAMGHREGESSVEINTLRKDKEALEGEVAKLRDELATNKSHSVQYEQLYQNHVSLLLQRGDGNDDSTSLPQPPNPPLHQMDELPITISKEVQWDGNSRSLSASIAS